MLTPYLGLNLTPATQDPWDADVLANWRILDTWAANHPNGGTGIDAVPANPSTWDDEFSGLNGDPIAAKWNRWNDGGHALTATIVAHGAQHGLELALPLQDDNSRRGYTQPLAGVSSDWEFTMAVDALAAANNKGISLVCYDSISGHWAELLLDFGSAWNLYAITHTSLADNSGTVQASVGFPNGVSYLRLAKVGTNLVLSYPLDSKALKFQTLATLAIATYFPGSSITDIGFAGLAFFATALDGLVYWFRKTA